MMMSVWQLWSNTKRAVSLQTDISYFADHFDGAPMPKDWTPPEIKVVAPSQRNTDFISWLATVPVVSEKAKEALSSLIGPYVQFLPLIKLKKQYYAMNVIHLVDCLDEETSRVTYRDDGTILNVYECFFKEDRLIEVPIFKLPNYTNSVFVTRSFVDCVIDNRLRGAQFQDPSQDYFGLIMQGKPINCVPEVLP